MSPAFDQSYARMIQAEGGYLLHKIKGDRGGLTYAGIARAMNPQWPGWAFVDRGEVPPTQLVRAFYHAGYWLPIRGDELNPVVADHIFKFAVNTSGPGRPALAVRLAQTVAGAEADGVLGPKSVAALNSMDEELFVLRYTVAKIKRYADICNADRSRVQARTFLLGWVNRTLEALR